MSGTLLCNAKNLNEQVVMRHRGGRTRYTVNNNESAVGNAKGGCHLAREVNVSG